MLNYTKKQEGSVLCVDLDGTLDTNTAPGFLADLQPQLGSLSKLVLNCEKLSYISSAGLRVLLTFQQELEEAGKTMEVHNVNDLIRDVFDVTGFLDILTIV
jgi:anti-sigma B factor antagonist